MEIRLSGSVSLAQKEPLLSQHISNASFPLIAERDFIQIQIQYSAMLATQNVEPARKKISALLAQIRLFSIMEIALLIALLKPTST